MTEIILGPPGTGKTTTLIGVVEEELARGVAPDRICYVSFTRRAAQEAVGRACQKFSISRKDLPHFSTLHSLCFRQLGLRSGDVLQGERMQEFADYAGVTITGRLSEDGTMSGFDPGDRILFMENLSRTRNRPLREIYDEFDDELPWERVRTVAEALLLFKKQHGLLDFTDMLSEFVRSGIRLTLDDLMVDEAQDLSPLQWLVVHKLTDGCARVVTAGDDDQAIYRWAGADVDHMIDMEGTVRVLGQSYRVPRSVQRVASGIISPIKHRRPKEWRSRDAEGAVDRGFARFYEVDCGRGQTLVLARNTYILREQVEPSLRSQGIVYERNGHPSIRTALMSAIQDWEMLRRGGSIAISAARRIYEWMSVGEGFRRGSKQLPGREDDETVNKEDLQKGGGLLRNNEPWYVALDRAPVQDVEYVRSALKRGEKLTERPRVVLSTIHGAKGGEADHVVLMREMAWRTARETQQNPEDERRVWYVAVTRARERLSVVESQTANRCQWL